MKTGKLVAMVMALGGLTIACGDDSNPGPSADGTTGETTGTTSTGQSSLTTGADSTGTGVGSGEADSGDSSSSSSSSGEPDVEVTVEGNVVDFLLEAAIPDSEISVYNEPGIMTTADSEGFYSIGTFAPNTGALFTLAPTEDYWGAVIPIDIGTDPLQEDVELTQISTSIVDMQIAQLEDQNPEEPDLDQAIVIVRLLNNTAVMEGPTTVTMDPPPMDGTYYAPDNAGVPTLNQSDITFPLIPVVVYFNIPDSDPGDITFTATHPTRECTVLYPELPTLGQHMTLVDVQCLPPSKPGSSM